MFALHFTINSLEVIKQKTSYDFLQPELCNLKLDTMAIKLIFLPLKKKHFTNFYRPKSCLMANPIELSTIIANYLAVMWIVNPT